MTDPTHDNMAERVANFDWSSSPLGEPDSWSPALRTAVDIVLASEHAMLLSWGVEKTVVFNDAFSSLLGTRGAQALGQSLRMAWPADWESAVAQFDQAASGESIQLQKVLVTRELQASGKESWWDFFLSPVRDGSALRGGVLVVATDVTASVRAALAEHARGEAQQRTAESEERLRGVLDGMGEAFGILSSDFTVLEHNREALRLDGRSRGEIVGRSHWDAFPGSETSELGRLLQKAMRERTAVSLEHRYEWESGQARWIEMRAYPTADGTLAVFWGDVTPRVDAQNALRESEAKYRALFESMDEAYAVVTVLRNEQGEWHDFRFLEVNSAFLVHTSMPWPVGKTATELLGSPNPRWAQLYGEALDTGQPIRVEESEPTLRKIFDLNIFTLDKSRDIVAVLFTDVTARRRAEDLLRESEERLGLALEIGQLASWDWDLRTDVVTWNDRHFHLQGYAVGEVKPSYGAWLNRVHPDDRANAIALIERARQTKQTYQHEFRTLLPDGSVRWCSARGRFFYDEFDSAYRMVGVTEDVTDRRQIQTELQQREMDLARVQRVGQVGGLDIDVANGLTSRRSPEYLRIHGLPPGLQNEVHTDWLRRVHPEDRVRAENTLFTALGSQATTFENEYRIIRPSDGEIRWIHARADIERDSDGRALRLVGAHIDVTEQKRMEQSIRDGEARYRTLIEHVRDHAIFLLDEEGLVIEWPASAERLTGYPSSLVLGRNLNLHYTSEDVAADVPLQLLKRAEQTGRADWEGWRVRHDGTRFWADEIVTAIRAATSDSTPERLLGFTVITRDQTQRRQAAEAVERARRETTREELRRALASAEEAERQRLSRELHDQLGQHLTAFSLGLDDAMRLLAKRDQSAETEGDSLATRLAKLQSLAARITSDARYIALELRPPELDDVGLEGALDTYIREWSARYNIAAEASITGFGPDLSVDADTVSVLYRVTQEALTNVARHAHATGVSVVVSITDSDIRLLVEDNGRGFRVAPTLRRARSERRLGLAGMQERAALLGGTVTVESTPGAGTTVYLTLPRGEQ